MSRMSVSQSVYRTACQPNANRTIAGAPLTLRLPTEALSSSGSAQDQPRRWSGGSSCLPGAGHALADALLRLLKQHLGRGGWANRPTATVPSLRHFGWKAGTVCAGGHHLQSNLAWVVHRLLISLHYLRLPVFQEHAHRDCGQPEAGTSTESN